MSREIIRNQKFGDIIIQLYRAGKKGLTNYRISGKGKKGTDMQRPESNAMSPSSLKIDSIINKLSDYSKTGIQVKRVDYYIDKKDVITPDVESICYRFSNKRGLTSSTLLISTVVKKSALVDRLVKKEDDELTSILRQIDNPRLGSIVYSWIDESFIENFNNINDNYNEEKNQLEKKIENEGLEWENYIEDEGLEWETYDEGYARLMLDKNFVCVKEFPNFRHNKSLSDIVKKNNIEKPWEYEIEKKCQYVTNKAEGKKCGGEIIAMPPLSVVKDFHFDNKENEYENVEKAIRQIIELGNQSVSMVNKVIKMDYKEYINTDKILVLPERMYYQTNDGHFKIEFDKLTDYQYTRTLGRTYEENGKLQEKLCWFKFTIFKNRKTYK